jgi:branched-chain amino acid aminotransferase
MAADLIYIDGTYYPKAEAKVSVFDHGLLYGDGIFEGIRAYNGKVFRLGLHIDRLFESAKAILLNIPLTKDEMKEVVLESCRRNGIRDGYVRLVVTRGVGDLGLNPYLCKKASVICIAATIQLYDPKCYEEGLKIVTVAQHRNHHEAVNPRIKSLNYLNNILAKIEAVQAGVVEAIMLNSQGYVAECTGDNIFILRHGKLLTPDVASGALEGITRRTVMEEATKLGYEVVEGLVTRFDVYTADECFVTGTAAKLVPVVQVDSRPIGDGKVGETTKKLLAAFIARTQWDGMEIGLPA